MKIRHCTLWLQNIPPGASSVSFLGLVGNVPRPMIYRLTMMAGWYHHGAWWFISVYEMNELFVGILSTGYGSPFATKSVMISASWIWFLAFVACCVLCTRMHTRGQHFCSIGGSREVSSQDRLVPKPSATAPQQPLTKPQGSCVLQR